ncbi:hypothetical protein SAMN05216419_103110 [Nitrosomonas cryotolerans]|uniref:hypothetical protein n=1 Tax=Nitrosomonas cryotolerans TaxID=44575 RepID=UPI0008E74471|nr:hypothetical protein [Nitrosomonas cryotolerans]SFP90560.1 hypothetical protein SAMN05216419_103110 [Nitrosomonas cryotolerans]
MFPDLLIKENTIARHPELEQNNFDLLRQIFAHAYPVKNLDRSNDIDFLSPATTIKVVNSGRLSFAFIAQQNENQAFLKMVKPGFVRSNIPFSVLCTEECRLHSTIPTFKTYPGANGQLYQIVSAKLANVSANLLSLFSGQTITLTEVAKNGIDSLPETLTAIPGGQRGQIALMQTLGEYIVKVSDAMQSVTCHLPADIDTADPAGFILGRQIAQDIFQISHALTYLRTNHDRRILRAHIEQYLPNLGQSHEAQAFKRGLEENQLEIILARFNQLEENINASLAQTPAQNVPIHNEIKPANVGAIYDPRINQWRITQSFDFDNIAFGTHRNGDHTPLEKDLGRTLSFFAFDAITGEFSPTNAQATVKGFLQRLPRKLNVDEIDRLKHYVQLGLVTSYLWRASYFADELHGQPGRIQLARINPNVHVFQLEAFEHWLTSNNWHRFISALQEAPAMAQHRLIAAEALRFRNSSEYRLKRNSGTLKAYYEHIDAAHEMISNAHTDQSTY